MRVRLSQQAMTYSQARKVLLFVLVSFAAWMLAILVALYLFPFKAK